MKQPIFSVTKDDFDIQTFRSGGHGGQHQNKTESGVRIIHRESGAVGESRTERSQHQNKKYAFRRLVASGKFQVWLKRKIFEIGRKISIEEEVETMIQNKYLKTEVKENGKWVPIENERSLESGEKTI
jgi:protein subunit release factor B